MDNSIDETGEHELVTSEIDIQEIEPPRGRSEPPPLPTAAKASSTEPAEAVSSPREPPAASEDMNRSRTLRPGRGPEQKPQPQSGEDSRPSLSDGHSVSDDLPTIESKLSSPRSQSKLTTSRPSKPPQPLKSAKPTAKPLSALRSSAAPQPPPQPARALEETALPENPRLIDAQKLIALCKQELAGSVDSQRASRLHFEIGNFYENDLEDIQSAAEHYQKAYRFQKNFRPAILGARRTLLNAQKHQEALPFFDAELPLISDPKQRAQLILTKGLVLEHDLHQRDQALGVYSEALKLDSTNLSLLRAVIRCQLLKQTWNDLDHTYQQMASASVDEPGYRAAIIAERARLFDIHRQDPAQAGQLYESAISLDPDTPGAWEALKRLSHTQGKWLQLIASLEQESTRSQDPEVRAAAQLNIAHLQLEKLGNTDEGIAALENAFRETPNDRTVLIKLYALYQENNRPHDLINCLERLFRLTEDQNERMTIANRIGGVYERDLRDDARSEFWHRQALEIDGGFRPALQALEKLYEKAGKWTELLALYENELKISGDPNASAALHYRIGDLLEVRLNDPARAAFHHAQALEFDPEHEAAFKALTRLLAQAERWSDLIEVYERMIDRAHHQQLAIAYLFRIGAVFEDRLKDPEGALHAYQRILRREPDNLGALQAVQRAASAAEKYDVLVRALEKEAGLTEKDQRRAAILYRAAEVFDTQLKDPLAAIDRLRRVLDLDNKHRLALDAIARIYYRAGRWEDLLAIYETELQETPGGSQWVTLSYKIAELIENQLGKPSEAVSRYRGTLNADPTHAASYHALARLLSTTRAWDELSLLIEDRIKSETDVRSKAYRALELAQLYEEKLQNEKKALVFYEKAIELSPGFRPAIDARARLLTKTKDYKGLAAELIREAQLSSDTALRVDTLLRAGAIQAELLNDPRSAVATFESVLKINANNLGALLALEALYLKVQDFASLERIYLQEVHILSHPASKIATLHDLANIHRSTRNTDDQNLQNIYRAIVELSPQDPVALEALAAFALRLNDSQAALVYQARLAAAATDPTVSALHHARVAAVLEQANNQEAIAAYRVALALDPYNFSAVRGLTRTAWSLGAPDALAEAAHHESTVTLDTPIAVELLLRAAKQRQARGDLERSIDDLEKALLLDPDHLPTTEILSSTMMQLGEVQKLADLLSLAADRARTPERTARLYTEVSDIKAKQLGSLPGAISAVERALAAVPGHLPALQRLAIYLEQTKQWERAIETYDQIVKQAQDDNVKIAAHMRLATLSEEYFDNRQRAYKSLKAILALDPSHKTALKHLGNLYARDGNHNQALSIAQRLVDTADNLADKAAALTSLARIYIICNQANQAITALSAAIEIQGAEGAAAKAYREMIGEHATWSGYVDTLRKYAARAREQKLPGGSSVRAIALVEVEQMRKPEQALKTLEEGIRDWPKDSALWVEYARQLNRAKRYDRTVEVSRTRIQADIFSPELWRELSKAYRALDRNDEAIHSAQPLLLLNAAANEELIALRSRQSKHASVMPGMLGDSLIQELQVEESLSNITVPLAESLSLALAKLFPADLKLYGLSRRDRIGPRSGNAFRATADQIAAIVGAPEFDLFFHQNPSNDITLELTVPPALMVPQWAMELSQPERVFLLARRLTTLARGLQAVDRLAAPELAVILTAAVRITIPDFVSSNVNPDRVDEMVRELKRILSRKERKSVEQASIRFSASNPPDFERWIRAVQFTVSRIALLLSDDIVASVKMIERTSHETLQDNALAADLVRFWVSDAAIRFRETLQD
ncbi:MAG: tetratricopeptide repeat protein [Deltaproteobacteria bacterium]|nr:tetratricopeptide repeat protein [Deltaproteobacteria bacterium]